MISYVKRYTLLRVAHMHVEYFHVDHISLKRSIVLYILPLPNLNGWYNKI